MNESEKSRLYFNMHNMIPLLYKNIYISLSQKKNLKSKHQNVNCSEIVSTFILLICIFYFQQ